MSDPFEIQGLDRLTDLTQGLGDALLDVAAADVARTFASQAGPDGTEWPELSSDYARWKAAHFPGAPMGVATGAMRRGLDSAERSVTETEAVWTFGAADVERDRADWFQSGDPFRNRPPRPFATGLSPEGERLSREVVERFLSEVLRGNQ